MVTCVLYNLEKKKEWDDFIDLTKTPLFLLKRDFLEYHSDRFTDSSFMFYEDGKLIALLPATSYNNEIISHGGVTYGGIILSEKIRSNTVQQIFLAMLNKMKELEITKLTYKAIPFFFHTQANQEDLYFLHNHAGAKLIRRDLSSVIYLNNRLKLSKGRKWLIARAKKMNLQVTPSSDFTSYHQLLTLVLSKHGTTPVHSIDELQRLANLFPNNIQLYVVCFENELVAGALVFKFNKVIHTQYLATSDKGKELGALDFLIENCIEQAAKDGFDYFSFGASTELQGKKLNEGLIAQKENFGARGVVLDFYEVEAI